MQVVQRHRPCNVTGKTSSKHQTIRVMSIALIVFVIVIIALIVICYAAAAFSYYNKEVKKEMKPVKLYLAGPITGVSEAKAKFEWAKTCLERYGYIVVTPFENGLPDDAKYEDHLKADFKLIDQCDAIALMPGWGDSLGCMREIRHCYDVNKKTAFLLDFQGLYWCVWNYIHLDNMLSSLFRSEKKHEFAVIRDNYSMSIYGLIAVYISMLQEKIKYADVIQ